MKALALALALLCSCAGVASAPSSLPYVRIDPTLRGPVMSRDAAIVVATKRLQDAKDCDQAITDIETDAKIMRFEFEQQKKRTDQALWWQKWGPTMLGTGITGAFAVGVAITLWIMQSFFRAP